MSKHSRKARSKDMRPRRVSDVEHASRNAPGCVACFFVPRAAQPVCAVSGCWEDRLPGSEFCAQGPGHEATIDFGEVSE